MMQIKLSTKSFGRDAAEVASQAIANLSKSLVSVDMSDVIAGRPEAEALDALHIMSNALSRLQLRCCSSQVAHILLVLACVIAQHTWWMQLSPSKQDALEIFGMKSRC